MTGNGYTLKRTALALVLAGIVPAAMAFQVRQEPSRFDPLVVHDPSASIGVVALSVDDIAPGEPLRAGWDAFRATHGAAWRVHLDRRSGAPLLVEGKGIPWIPGRGNALKRTAPVTLEALETSLRSFIATNRGLLLANDSELVLDRAASGAITPELWRVVFGRTVDGIPVRGERYAFTIGHGNLVSFGTPRWSPIGASTSPTLDPSAALGRLFEYMGLTAADPTDMVEPARLELVPVAAAGTRGQVYTGPEGAGYATRLVWRFLLRVGGEPGTWVGLVDAHDGSILALYDDDKYALVKGGVLPESPDGSCPSGCEQPGYPIPFADIDIEGDATTAGSYGQFECSPAGFTATTTLAGPYVRVADRCGAVSESVACNEDLDLGVNAGADCAVPAGSSAGNTKAARTSYYHLNRIAELARGWLPGNTWLNQQLVDNVNINSNCNAFWNGTVNFYTSGGGCNNTGEIAGVINHEWGHGMDGNDGGGFDNPSEAYADVVEFLYDHTSCIGRGFRVSANCGGYGNSCLNCTGIRDMDWDQRQDQTPSTPSGFLTNNCGNGSGPCGKQVHCEGYVSAETIWDLAARDLPAAGLDQDSAWQLADRLWYQSRAGSGGDAYNCALPSSDGCGATSWFTKIRTADDDDGDLSNGTPHAAAIFAAFDRHDIACGNASDASNQDSSSCPTLAAPALTVTPGSSSASLSWTSVTDADSYNIFRNDFGCSHSFARVASVAAPGTSFTDTGLADGFSHTYRVQAVGTNSVCESPVSNCESVVPLPFAGTISFDKFSYACSVTMKIIVRDANVGSSTTTATVFSSTETTPETVTLTETAPGSHRFEGTIVTTTSAPAADGALSIADGDTITARYTDADDGEGGVNITRETTAAGDCTGPAISDVQSTGVTDTQATITWMTDEGADSLARWGPSTPPANTDSKAGKVTSHSIPLTGLQQCTVYFFEVESTDPPGNVAVDDNGGAWHHFETLGDFGQGLQPCHQGRVTLDLAQYSCADTVEIELIDIDLNQDPGVAETVQVELTSTSETDPEIIVLTETGPGTSTFSGSITTDPGAVASDGKLQTVHGDLITASYRDADDGTGSPAVAFATAQADCAGPVITNIAVTDLPPGRVQVTWTTSEPADSRIDWGTSPALGNTVSDGPFVTSHSLFIGALDFCGAYFFSVTSTDPRGNTTVEDLGGAAFTFQTGQVPGTLVFDPFIGNQGWTLLGEWEIDAPQGLGPSSGDDPSSAWSGAAVLGTDLTGLGANPGSYEPNESVSATSPVFDGSLIENEVLRFRRWLNVGQQPDRARLVLQVGGSVIPVYASPDPGEFEGSWQLFSYDLSASIGDQDFQLTFSLESDGAGEFGGWNIDDLIIKDGAQPEAAFCGGCASEPSFAGAASAVDADPCADTGITITWPAAAAWGSSGAGTYSVYRDTTAGFTPSASNRIATGLTGLSYTDNDGPDGVTLHYLVRAENDEACGGGPNNSGVEDGNTVYVAAADELSQPLPADVGASVRVSMIAATHVRIEWAATAGAASYSVSRADDPQMTGAVSIGTTPGLLLDDVGEATTSQSRYYEVRGLNSCGEEGP